MTPCVATDALYARMGQRLVRFVDGRAVDLGAIPDSFSVSNSWTARSGWLAWVEDERNVRTWSTASGTAGPTFASVAPEGLELGVARVWWTTFQPFCVNGGKACSGAVALEKGDLGSGNVSSVHEGAPAFFGKAIDLGARVLAPLSHLGTTVMELDPQKPAKKLRKVFSLPADAAELQGDEKILVFTSAREVFRVELEAKTVSATSVLRLDEGSIQAVFLTRTSVLVVVLHPSTRELVEVSRVNWQKTRTIDVGRAVFAAHDVGGLAWCDTVGVFTAPP